MLEQVLKEIAEELKTLNRQINQFFKTPATVEEPVVCAPAKEDPAKTSAKEKPGKEEPAEEPTKEEPVKETGPTLDDVRAALRDLSQRESRDAAKKVVAVLGFDRVSDIPEDQYAAVIEACNG